MAERIVSREILQPFQVGVFGNIAFVEDPVESARQRIMALLLTRRGERVMNPNYGTDLWQYLFEGAAHFASADLAAHLTAAVNRWEPSITIQSVEPVLADTSGTAVSVKISFQIAGFNEIHETVVDITGARIEV